MFQYSKGRDSYLYNYNHYLYFTVGRFVGVNQVFLNIKIKNKAQFVYTLYPEKLNFGVVNQ